MYYLKLNHIGNKTQDSQAALLIYLLCAIVLWVSKWLFLHLRLNRGFAAPGEGGAGPTAGSEAAGRTAQTVQGETPAGKSESPSLEPANGKNSRQSVIILGSAVYFSLLGWACVCLCKDHLSHVVPTLWGDFLGLWFPPLWSFFPPNRHVLCLNLPLEKQRQQTCGCNRSLYLSSQSWVWLVYYCVSVSAELCCMVLDCVACHTHDSVCACMLVTQSCPALCDRMDSSVHRILEAKILEWIAISFSKICA